MKIVHAAILAAAILPATAAFAAGPASNASGTTPGASTDSRLHLVGDRDGRSEPRGDCKPYNGPYGYYGNPYCEGGFNRYGKAGGYEIDLTRFFDERTYSDDRRDRRRWR